MEKWSNKMRWLKTNYLHDNIPHTVKVYYRDISTFSDSTADRKIDKFVLLIYPVSLLKAITNETTVKLKSVYISITDW